MAAHFGIDQALIESDNESARADLARDYEALGERLARRGIEIDPITRKLRDFSVAIPTWGVGTGGTRFGRFPIAGGPRNIYEKIDDCGVIRQLVRSTPTISPHFPWDTVDDYDALKAYAADRELAFDAVNSNTFQDQPGQTHSYQFGSLTHPDPAVRAQAIEHNLECIEIGQKLGSKAITVWIGDGSNFPGQQNFVDAFDRYLDAMTEIYARLPADWRVFIEHKLFEPALYATVINDWGTSYIAATSLGPKARCLVDLGHHAPNTNIEMIVARLVRFGRLAGFHFNDSKYGDDDLDSGAINPFQLFLIFNELVDAEQRGIEGFDPAYMMDQSHNVTDPIESLITSAMTLQRSYAQASLVRRHDLRVCQQENDALMAATILRTAYHTDVDPILATARLQQGGSVDPFAVYRKSGYRKRMAEERRQDLRGARAGIV